MVKKVLITGANKGLGKALAQAFSKAGYHIIFVCRSGVEDLFKKQSGEKIDGTVIEGDIRDPNCLERIHDAVASKYEGGLDILINNAAVYRHTDFTEMTPEEIQEMVSTNLTAPIQLTKLLWPYVKHMVININSIAGRVGAEREELYCATKHGLSGFTKALQYKGTKDNKKVLSVYLGALKTHMKAPSSEEKNYIDPNEVAKVVVDLCSSEQSSLRITEIVLTRNNYKENE